MSGEPLQGQWALVTGAGRRRGMGRAIALELARLGADVVVHASPRSPETFPQHERETGWLGAASVAEEIVALGRRAIPLHADLGAPAGARELAERVLDEAGPIQVLVNNAGAAGTSGSDTIVELDPAVWYASLQINLSAAYELSAALIPAMLEAGGGSIVHIGSGAGIKPRALFGSYPAAKAGLVALTRQMALEFAPTVRTNCVCPGSTETDMLDGTFARRDALAGAEPGTWRKGNVASIPMLRHAEPADIASAVAFFATPSSSFVTGQVLCVDGGQDLR